ncbi:MAG: hypothetical protein ABSA77_11010, partial [Thermoguttaceae bacterium]
MSTFAKKIKRLAVLSLAGSIICALTAATASTAETWTAGSGTDLYWSTATNWSGSAVPVSTDDVTFNATGVGTTTELKTEGETIKSLWYSQSVTGQVHTTQIDGGYTLKIVGANATAQSGFTQLYSLYAGNVGAAATSSFETVITGDGTLDVSNASNGDTGGSIMVTMLHGTGGSAFPDHTSVLDLSGLATFNANVDQLMVGAATSSSYRPNGVMY